MALGRTIGMAVLGLLGGAVAGSILGLCGGLAYTQLTNASSFEGYSGFVVIYWLLSGLIIGAIAGTIFSVSKSRRAKTL